jgi:putative transcriptional regulator
MSSALTALVVVAGLALAGTQAGPVPAPGPLDTRSLTGQLLVATEEMRDPRFHHMVIYLLQHDAGGAVGIIVNQPLTDAPIATVLEKLGRPTEGVTGSIRIHYGGPVDPTSGFVLHTSDWTGASTRPVRDGVAFTTDATILEAIGHGTGPRRSLFATGYSGWGPGQLEEEIERGAWITVTADEELIFGTNAASKWERATARQRTVL